MGVKMKKIEILAPAGSYESLVAAVNASCDAVYIGGTKFGARAYADNLTDETMLRAIDYIHIHDKKIYMAVNTLLKNAELEQQLYDYLYPYYKQGLDAVIVQDTGVLQFIGKYFPELPIHASTQMSLTMAQGAEVLKHKGVTRIVTARELGLEEIKTLRKGTDLEIESFVHGALCYCYSGQCLMSSMIGGRSGNRGRCAQPCRMPYQLLSDGRPVTDQEEKYLLSPKDICTLDIIPQLIEAGIDSFKIEGRMKRPEYTAGVTAAYRKYTDKYLELGKENYEIFRREHKDELRQDIMDLKDLYNRGGFTEGYYSERNGKSMISLNRPNHSGVLVGNVVEVKNNQAVIKLVQDINAQDILEIRDLSENLYEFTVKSGEVKGSKYYANFKKGTKVMSGNNVYRTRNNKLITALSKDYLENEDKILISGELKVQTGKTLKLRLNCKDSVAEVTGELAEEAKNQPMTEDKLRKQLLKTNDTAFEFKDLSIQLKGNSFIPVQKINELRRNGITALSEAIAEQYRRSEPNKRLKEQDNKQDNTLSYQDNRETLGISAAVSTKEQVLAACEVPEVTNIYLESDAVPFLELTELTGYIRNKGKKCYLMLPYIFRKAAYENFLRNKTILTDNTINGYILRCYEEYYFVTKELQAAVLNKELITDYNLYVMNRSGAEFWMDLGICNFTAPVELNYNELKEMVSLFHDIIVYGYLPLMISAQCLIKTVTGGSNKNFAKTNDTPCCGIGWNEVDLTDRFQKNFQVKRHCRECYNTIYNSQCLSLLSNSGEVKELKARHIRLNFTKESYEATKKVLGAFIESYIIGSRHVDEIKDFTRGHFKRGVE
jgi:putative protease